MDLSPREVSFIRTEMEKVEEDETRQPTARVEAESIRKEAETSLTE